jgi:hypothetical protein
MRHARRAWKPPEADRQSGETRHFWRFDYPERLELIRIESICIYAALRQRFQLLQKVAFLMILMLFHVPIFFGRLSYKA